MAQHIVHYKGRTIIYDNGVYKVDLRFFLSMTEAIRQIDKTVKDESFFNLKQLNDKTNKATIKQG